MALDWTGYQDDIPEHTKDALERYLEDRYLPGGFLTAVLSNDLFGAIGRADAENAVALPYICQFIYNRFPAGSWGSEKIVFAFLEDAYYERVAQSTKEK